MAAAGAGPIEPWLQPEGILSRIWPLLPTRLRLYADQTIAAWQQLPPDPYGTTYGFFDGHGWNMAFDHARNRLNGIYDFADSGFGPLHQEFIYPNWIAPDLTARIVAEYEVLTGLALDRQRIDLLSSVLRLSELAEYADDIEHAPAMVQNVADWAAREPGFSQESGTSGGLAVRTARRLRRRGVWVRKCWLRRILGTRRAARGRPRSDMR